MPSEEYDLGYVCVLARPPDIAVNPLMFDREAFIEELVDIQQYAYSSVTTVIVAVPDVDELLVSDVDIDVITGAYVSVTVNVWLTCSVLLLPSVRFNWTR